MIILANVLANLHRSFNDFIDKFTKPWRCGKVGQLSRAMEDATAMIMMIKLHLTKVHFKLLCQCIQTRAQATLMDSYEVA